MRRFGCSGRIWKYCIQGKNMSNIYMVPDVLGNNESWWCWPACQPVLIIAFSFHIEINGKMG